MKFNAAWHPQGEACAKALRERLPELEPVDWTIVGGSGIGRPLVEEGEHALGLEIEHQFPLTEIGAPAPSVAGHGSSLVFGKLPREGGDPVHVCIQTGRIHPYEGHGADVTTGPLGAVLSLGCKH